MVHNKKNTQVRKVKTNKVNTKTNNNVVQPHHQHDEAEIEQISIGFLRIADRIDNPRKRDGDYPLNEILLVALIAVLCGSESYQDFVTFGETQTDWFRQFVPLENGVPSHDTFRRVLMLLKPETLNNAYHEILQGLNDNEPDKTIAIDGKKSLGCYNVKGQSLLHMVSAWDTENGVCLGQLATKNDEGKEVGEFHTIPKLIDQLNVKGHLVTVDAGGCYAEITGSIVAGGGDYAITLKENQPKLHEMTKTIFEEHERNDFAEVACYQETSRGHGRVEDRTYYATPVPTGDPRLTKWPGITSVVMGKFRRSVVGGKTAEHIRYYISSLSSDCVTRLGQSLRSHWGIENGLHWVLDVTFGEDANRTRRGNGAENLSILRRLSLVMLKKVKGKKTIPNVKFQAAVDPAFRTNIMKMFFMR